ncbi:NRDE family protein [Polaromonas sp.]|uniref:NRDE family protein n=1 Tax=Polaromonas sp. TaxID=1869339 RepID=UPI001819BFDD|nr:NRDE family protein [Polaromonas sp.]NMM07433.1 NRDE family protein [Polaromonas sp.]
MCLVAFAINSSARWPLVIAANRDEFLNRPTLPLGRWHSSTGQEIIAGRDLRSGGTWLGITPGGRVAFLTNVREAEPPTAPRSRGELVTRWLEASGDARDFALALEQDGAAYGGFNLVLGDFQTNAWTWLTNRLGAASTLHMQALAPGVYGLSNAALNTPWPKTTALQRVLADALTAQAHAPTDDTLQDLLWTALGNRERTPHEQLPATGVPLAMVAMEEALSSAFVDFPERAYGTRSSTLLLACARDDRADLRRWDMTVQERTHLHLQRADKTGSSRVNGADTALVSSDLVSWRQKAAL